MESLPEAFHRLASARLAEYPNLVHKWSGPEKDGKRVLLIPKAEVGGFDVRIECETYGLYPYADEWHGAPWEAPPNRKTSNEAISEDCLGFVRSVLCTDATLMVFVAAGKPYKWILSYPWAGKRANDETGTLLFNYFGRREKRIFQNNHLSPREETLQSNNQLQRDAAQAPRI